MPLTVNGIISPIPTERQEFISEQAGGFDFKLKIGICIRWLASIAKHPKAKVKDRLIVAYGDILITQAQVKADFGTGLDAGLHLRRAGLQPDLPLIGAATGFGAAVEEVAHKEGAALLLVRTKFSYDYAIGIYRTAKKIVLFAPGAGELAPIRTKHAARNIDPLLDLGRDEVSSYIGHMVTLLAIAKTGPQGRAPLLLDSDSDDEVFDQPTATGATTTAVEREPLYASLERGELLPYAPPRGTTAHVPRPGILGRNK